MILRKLGKSTSRALLFTGNQYSKGRFQKFLFVLRRILNKMANEQTRTFKDESLNINPNLPADAPPKQPTSQLEIEKDFLKNQAQITTHEKSRLARIDEILGTKTYFHEIKNYQQRVSYDNIVQVKYLKDTNPQEERGEIDILNPQIPSFLKYRKKRKFKKFLTSLKKYPTGNTQLDYFEERPGVKDDLNQNINAPLIKFLSQEELYVRFALSELSLTIDSVMTEKVEEERDGEIVNLQSLQDHFVYNGQIYFRPITTRSIYRIDQQKFSKKFQSSLDSLSEALVLGTGRVQQVVSLEQIYECLKTFYYDERVNEYLGKIENQQLSYLFTSFHVSPDGTSVFFVIDLLDNKKQFVGMFKQLDPSGKSEGISPANVIFNFRAEVALRNHGALYFIQRSQEGLFTQFSKTNFDTKIFDQSTKDIKQNQKEQKSIQKSHRPYRILYKCKPFQELKILENKEVKIEANDKFISSQNILLEEMDIGSKTNNRIYLVLPQFDSSPEIKMQLITENNDKLPQLYSKWGVKGNGEGKWPIDGKQFYTECHEIMSLGYLIVRYCFVTEETGSRLKYGFNKKYAFYVSFVPYACCRPSSERVAQDLLEQQKAEKKLIGEKEQLKQKQSLPVPESIKKIRIDLPSEQSILFSDPNDKKQEEYRLEMEKQSLVHISQQNFYMTDLEVRHGSISNVYMLINNSVDSVYNRNSLYIQSLKENVKPYSLYLDGFPIQIKTRNIGAGQTGKLSLKLMAPLLPVQLQFTVWKKEIKQYLSKRIYTETIKIKESEEGDIVIKILSNSKYVNRKAKQKHEVQPVILYIPSQNQRLDEIAVQKLLEKGVMFVEIVSCRGNFGSTMIELLRGSKQFYGNYIDDIYETILFIKENISERLGIYAQGPNSCFATLLLNITENQQNQLFDCSVLHEGLYDTRTLNQNSGVFFGSDPQVFKDVNPFSFPIYDPTKSQQENELNPGQVICNLSKIVFSSLDQKKRAESRKFVNKLRGHRKIVYETVYLKQFDNKNQKDIFNLSYLYRILNQNLRAQYFTQTKQKHEQIKQKGQAMSRDNKDRPTSMKNSSEFDKQ